MDEEDTQESAPKQMEKAEIVVTAVERKFLPFLGCLYQFKMIFIRFQPPPTKTGLLESGPLRPPGTRSAVLFTYVV